MFRLPLDFSDGSKVWGLTNGSQRADMVRHASLIWLDEAPMLHRYFVEIIDRSLRDLMKVAEPFGGKVVVLSGDFRQLAPVVPYATTLAEIAAASLRSSPIFPGLRRMHLTVAHRQAGSDDYVAFLMQVGNGTIAQHTLADDSVGVVGLPLVSSVPDGSNLINFVFSRDLLSDPDECAKRAVLCTHNVDVDDTNHQLLQDVEGDEIVCASADFVHAEDLAPGEFIDDELLHQATGKGVPPDLLRIKKGAVCMITRNLNSDDGLVNGSKVIVVDVTPRLVIVRLPGSQERMGIPR
ncbi:ATP-dependent DNA helicase PIF1-like, partial [Frankliniella occidentalis]|uniref:ATP-dependent DNA helicase n=1 Tax=Frankliniella occidentalis TaxID=133901 RepID=A0A6J1TK21_FRAOC